MRDSHHEGAAQSQGARTAQGDILHDGHILPDDSSLSDDDPRAMVQQDALADAGCWVDVDGAHLAHAGLKRAGHDLLVAEPQRVRNAMRLQRVIALVEQQGRAVHAACRVLSAARRRISSGCSCMCGLCSLQDEKEEDHALDARKSSSTTSDVSSGNGRLRCSFIKDANETAPDHCYQLPSLAKSRWSA